MQMESVLSTSKHTRVFFIYYVLQSSYRKSERNEAVHNLQKASSTLGAQFHAGKNRAPFS